MRLFAIAFVVLVSSLSFSACVEEKVVVAPPAAAKAEPRRPTPAPAPAPAPVPTRESVKIGPNGVAIETSDAKREGSVEIAFPKR